MQEARFRGLIDYLKDKGFHVGKDPYQFAYVRAMADAIGEGREGSKNAVFVDAPAGTGKTTLAVLTGVYAVERGLLDKILYLRTEDEILGGKDRGALPGNDGMKFAPFRAPFVEALDLASPGLWEKWSGIREEMRYLKQYGLVDPFIIERGAKAIATHPGYFRGKTRSRVFAILDEAQNWRRSQLQAVYTRFTNDSVVVTIGHSGQCDIPRSKEERIGGLLPFQVFALHHQKRGAWVGTLRTNYRGAFAEWSDEIHQTIKELREEPPHLRGFFCYNAKE